jgi:hypothetical protein
MVFLTVLLRRHTGSSSYILVCGSCFLPCRWAWRCLQCILSSRSIIRSTNIAELQTQRNLSNGSPFKHYRFQIRSGYALELDTITPKHYNAKPGSRQLTSRRRMLMSRTVRSHDQETSTPHHTSIDRYQHCAKVAISAFASNILHIRNVVYPNRRLW